MKKPPFAKQKKHSTFVHGIKIDDNYSWLRDKSWPKVENREILQYIEKENNYSKKYFVRSKPLQEKLYQEMISRIKLTDTSTPIKKRNFYYYTKTYKTKQYLTHFRKNARGEIEVLFDENKESKKNKFFNLGGLAVSPCEQFLAYSLDTIGNEFFYIEVRKIKNQNNLTDRINDTIGSPIWDSNSKGFYYLKLNSKWRPNKIYYHKIGTNQKDDKLIYEEKDQTFRLGLSKSTDEKYIYVTSSSSTSQELMMIREHKVKLLIKRKPDHLFEVDHFKGSFFLLTNDQGKNFRLVSTANETDLINSKFLELIPHKKSEYITDFQPYNDHLVITKKVQGLEKIMVYNYKMELLDELNFEDPSYHASHIYTWYDDIGFIVQYSSMRTPKTTYQYLFGAQKLKILKEQLIPSGYKKEEYQSERLHIQSRDKKTKIPVSIIYKKSLMKENGANPLLLYGYGSYGISVPPTFNTNVISLLDRGFIFAIAHIRGGDDLGFEWYESAKFLNKKRTFNDFNDIIRFFANSKYSRPKKISIMGGSAGGMLVGVSLNEESSLVLSAIADVPFVDVLNTMLDDTLPLTPFEYKEWGNPKEKEFFDYIKSYSPYDNIKRMDYPHIYVLAGLNDPRVTYWEPAKYVAKLRELKTDNNTLILETQMNAGHQGASGKFTKYKEVSKKYAFLLLSHGITS